MLAVDEMVEGGKILEIDSHAISNRVLMRDAGIDGEQANIADMTIGQAFSSARDQFIRSIR